MMRKLKWMLALVGLALVVVVAVQNNQPVTIKALFWTAQVDRLILFPLLFLAGLVVGLLLGWGWQRKKSSVPAPKAP